MEYLFYECSSLKSFPDISNWNTGKVKDMGYSFGKCSSITSIPDISKWNTDRLQNLEKMFTGCPSLLKNKVPSKFKKGCLIF